MVGVSHGAVGLGVAQVLVLLVELLVSTVQKVHFWEVQRGVALLVGVAVGVPQEAGPRILKVTVSTTGNMY